MNKKRKSKGKGTNLKLKITNFDEAKEWVTKFNNRTAHENLPQPHRAIFYTEIYRIIGEIGGYVCPSPANDTKTQYKILQKPNQVLGLFRQNLELSSWSDLNIN